MSQKQFLTPKKKGFSLPTTDRLYHKGVPANITWLVFCGFFRKEYLYINSKGKIIKREKINIGFNNLKAIIKTFLPWYLKTNKEISRTRIYLLLESLIVAPWPGNQRGSLFRLVSQQFLRWGNPQTRQSYNFIVQQHQTTKQINYLAQPQKFLDTVFPTSQTWNQWIREFEEGIEQEKPEVPYETAFETSISVSPDQDDEPPIQITQTLQTEQQIRENRAQRLRNLLGTRLPTVLPFILSAGMAMNQLRAMKPDPVYVIAGAMVVGGTLYNTWRTWNNTSRKKGPDPDPDPDPDDDPNEIKWEKEIKPKQEPEEYSLDRESLRQEEEQQDPKKKFEKEIKYIKENMERQEIHPTWLRKN